MTPIITTLEAFIEHRHSTITPILLNYYRPFRTDIEWWLADLNWWIQNMMPTRHLTDYLDSCPIPLLPITDEVLT